LSPLSAELVRAGYIVAVEDVRGKYKSEGEYVMNRPVRGPLNPTAVDHSTDAWDTIDWLIKNVPESNGRVGSIGTSYDGFTALMTLVNPHPALKASVPINPMVDVWKGDDWFHNGAFRQEMISYVYGQTATKASGEEWFTGAYDDYATYLRHGSAGAYGHAMGMEQLPFWDRLVQHPAYDEYWQDQAVDRILADWPQACMRGCPANLTPLYLASGERLSFDAPAIRGFNQYVSDPAKPVTYRQRPNLSPWAPGSTWRYWLVDDQRFAEGRPDVLTYEGAPLTQPLRLAGTPLVHLVASTSGTDSDWVVKLIDVYPDQYPQKPDLGGYQLAIA